MRVSKSKLTSIGGVVAALFAVPAFAVVNMVPTASTGATYFASEITATAAAPRTLTGAGNIFDIGAAATTDSGVTLGTGIAPTQKRFLKLSVTNAQFVTAPTIAAVNKVGTNGNTNMFALVTPVAGGAGSSFIIFEVTGNATAPGSLQTDTVVFTIPDLAITSTAGSVTLLYEAYETQTGAGNSAAPTGALALSSKSATLIGFAPTVSVTSTTAGGVAQTITANSGYKNITATSASATRGRVSTVSLALGTAPGAIALRRIDGTTAVLGDALAATGSTLTVAGDLGGADAVSSIILNPNSSSCATAALNGAATVALGITGTPSATSKTASSAVVPFNTNQAGPYAVCYLTNGTYILPNATYTTTFTGASNANYSVATTGPFTTATWTRDGSTLESPWVTTTTGYISRFFITQTTVADVPYQATVRNASGIVPGGTLTGTLPAGKQTQIQLATLLPADTSAYPGPYQVSFAISATNTVVSGSYVLTVPNGAVTNTPMQQPGLN